QVRSVLFHGAERKQDDRARIAREPRRIQVRTLAQLDHVAPVRSPVERGRRGIICRPAAPAALPIPEIRRQCRDSHAARPATPPGFRSPPATGGVVAGSGTFCGHIPWESLTPKDTSGDPNGPVPAWQLRSISFTAVPVPATLLRGGPSAVSHFCGGGTM